LESTYVKVHNTLHLRNKIACSTNCKYLHKGDDDDDDDNSNNNNNNNNNNNGTIKPFRGKEGFKFCLDFFFCLFVCLMGCQLSISRDSV